jgi:hypothetical protein
MSTVCLRFLFVSEDEAGYFALVRATGVDDVGVVLVAKQERDD